MRKWQNAIIKAKFGGETYCCVPWPMIANDTKGSQLKFRKLMFASLRLLSQPATTWPVSCGLRNREVARALYPELFVSSETSAPTAKQIMSSVEQLLATLRDHELVQGKKSLGNGPKSPVCQVAERSFHHRHCRWCRPSIFGGSSPKSHGMLLYMFKNGPKALHDKETQLICSHGLWKACSDMHSSGLRK